MYSDYLDFEKPIAELEQKIEELHRVEVDGEVNLLEEVKKLKGKSEDLTRSNFFEVNSAAGSAVSTSPIAAAFDRLHSSGVYGFSRIARGSTFRSGACLSSRVSAI